MHGVRRATGKIRRVLLVGGAFLASLLVASVSLAGIIVEDKLADNKTPVWIVAGQIYRPDARGVLKRVEKGIVRLAGRRTFDVAAGSVRRPGSDIERLPVPDATSTMPSSVGRSSWGLVQREEEEERLLLRDGQLFIARGPGDPRPAPDGVYRRKAGTRFVVKDGQVVEADLTGMTIARAAL